MARQPRGPRIEDLDAETDFLEHSRYTMLLVATIVMSRAYNVRLLFRSLEVA